MTTNSVEKWEQRGGGRNRDVFQVYRDMNIGVSVDCRKTTLEGSSQETRPIREQTLIKPSGHSGGEVL